MGGWIWGNRVRGVWEGIFKDYMSNSSPFSFVKARWEQNGAKKILAFRFGTIFIFRSITAQDPIRSKNLWGREGDGQINDSGSKTHESAIRRRNSRFSFPANEKEEENPVSFFPFIRFRPGKLVVGLKGNLRVSEAAFLRRWVFSDRRKEKNRKIGAFCRLGIHEI